MSSPVITKTGKVMYECWKSNNDIFNVKSATIHENSLVKNFIKESGIDCRIGEKTIYEIINECVLKRRCLTKINLRREKFWLPHSTSKNNTLRVEDILWKLF